MITKIKRHDSIIKFPKLPLRQWNLKKEEFDLFFPETFGTYVLTLPSKSYRGLIKSLGIEITNLTKVLGYDSLTFLGDSDISWLYRDHEFKPAKEALQYLSDNKVGKRFNGALQVDTTGLPTFIKHLAWLVRCNAVLPYIYFIDADQSFFGTVCQYGNLHISTMNKKSDITFKREIAKSKLEYMTVVCYDQFSKSTKIRTS